MDNVADIIETTVAEVQDIVVNVDNSDLIQLLDELRTSLTYRLGQLQVGINYTNELLHSIASNMEVVKAVALFVLLIAGIIVIYRFLSFII